jgi:putative SOS response-associated peptidase YedK
MCNLYAMTKTREAVRQLAQAMLDSAADQPTLPAIFPDQMAPIIRTTEGGDRVMEAMRWGFPPPLGAGTRPVTNVRNTGSSYWRTWLGKPQYRCLVPATSFCEYQDGSRLPTWFALGADRPLFAFAGIWRPWTGLRGKEEAEHRLFAFLTTQAAKAMPVVLAEADWETWLTASREVALDLQTAPAPAGLQIVATGARKDG